MTWNNGLSPDQIIAAQHFGSHGRLLAGPGTGKTKAMTARIAYLVEVRRVQPSDILALTFTRAATRELKNRVALLLGMDVLPPRILTLHSFALRSILQSGAGDRLPAPIRIADDYEERQIIEEDIKRLLDLTRVSQARDLLSALSADWETLEADTEGWDGRFPNSRFIGAWQEHRAIYGYTLRAELVYQLKKALEEGSITLSTSPSHVLVDEYQDLNPCDLSIIKSLAAQGAEIYVAGDDDQSIYGFRYAEPEGIRRFILEYAGAANLILTECHRCGREILRIAEYVASQDLRRLPKPLVPCETNDAGEVHLLRFNSWEQEALGIAHIASWLVNHEGVPVDQILVLLRTDRNQGFSDPIRVALGSVGLRAVTIEDPLVILETRNGRVFLSLLRLVVNPQDHLAWRDLIMNRDNHLGEQAIVSIYDLARNRGITFSEAIALICENSEMIPRQGERIRQEFRNIDGELQRVRTNYENSENLTEFIEWMIRNFLSFENADEIIELVNDIVTDTGVNTLGDLVRELTSPIQDTEQIKEQDAVNIMTMHQAKGLDAKAVFIVAAEDEYIPGRAEGSKIDDERRLLYVSITRARSFLYITHCIRRTGGQRHTGRTSGSLTRTLTRFLRGGPLISTSGQEYISDIISL